MADAPDELTASWTDVQKYDDSLQSVTGMSDAQLQMLCHTMVILSHY